MSNFGPAPFWMTMKISPSVDPRSHLSSVRFEGCVPSGAIGPLPLASAPWQKRQFFWKVALPAAIESALDATGFFSFLPSGLPPGFCARADTATSARQAKASEGMTTDDRRRMMDFISFVARVMTPGGRLGRRADSHIPLETTQSFFTRPDDPIV